MSLELPITILLARAMTASGPSRTYDDFEDEFFRPTDSTVRVGSGQLPQMSGIGKIVSEKISRLLADEGSFEEDEPRPSDEAIKTLQLLIEQAETIGSLHCIPDLSTFYGEIAATWKIGKRTLRLATFSDNREPILYFQEDRGEPLPEGQTIKPARPREIAERLKWVMGIPMSAVA